MATTSPRPGDDGRDSSLDLQDYLEAAGDASRRTRTTIISIVVTTVLVFSVFLNSLDTSWMHRRLLRLASPDHDSMTYREQKIGPPPPATVDELSARLGPEEKEAFRRLSHAAQQQQLDNMKEEYKRRYEAFYASLARVYAESAFVVRVPFFGITVDANDTGVLGGFAFLILLVLLRFCLAREIDNLLLAFEAAASRAQLDEFYHLLAMRQVFTVPKTRHDEIRVPPRKYGEAGEVKPRRELLWMPKALCVLPLAVQSAVCLHDLSTFNIGGALYHTRALSQLIVEVLFLGLIVGGTYMCVTKLRDIDGIWADQWNKVKNPNYQRPKGVEYYL